MRINSFTVKNFRGVRFSEASGLADHPVLLISGKNGTGKSLVLEALLAAWTGEGLGERSCIGSWGSMAEVTIEVVVNDQERARIAASRFGNFSSTDSVPSSGWLRREWRGPGMSYSTDADELVKVISDQNFRDEHPFGVIDFVPADRTVSIAQQMLSIDLGIFGEKRIKQDRKATIENYLKHKSTYYPGDVVGFLATSHYLDLLAGSEGIPGSGEYETIAGRFEQATGKKISKPHVDFNSGISISIEPQHGHRHAISEVSSGEASVLSLMYFVRRLSARGGVLLIDELEQHLHPTLQVALLDLMAEMSDRGQIILVTHSPNLVASIDPVRLFEMSAPGDEGVSQLVNSAADEQRNLLLSDLGLVPSAIVQSDALVIVEGRTDRDILNTFFPIMMSRCRVEPAGDVARVMSACDTLQRHKTEVSWLCIRDRDFLADDEVSRLTEVHPGLFVWPYRMIENVLLDVELIYETLKKVNGNIKAESIEEELLKLAEQDKEDVIIELVKHKLTKVDVADAGVAGGKVEKLKAHYVRQKENYIGKIAGFDACYKEVSSFVALNWDRDWRVLANGKSIIAKFSQSMTPFRRWQDLIAALSVTYDQGTARPAALEAIRLRLQGVVSGD